MGTGIPVDFRGRAVPLGPHDITDEAAVLGCSIAIIHAFSDLESGGVSGFLSDGRPKILFEAHGFHQRTGGRFDLLAPNVSSPSWDRSLYGAGGAHQYARLATAMKLASTEALESCSLGRYQVMASNFHMVGFASPQEMWAEFCDSEREHLLAFGAFCKAAGLVPALRADPPEFVRLAIGYNGAGERANGYDQKLEVAWDHYIGLGENVVVPSLLAPDARTLQPSLPPLPPPGPAPRMLLMAGMAGDDVAQLQKLLGGLKADGRFGAQTKAAVIAFQRAHGLPQDGDAGPRTLAKLRPGA